MVKIRYILVMVLMATASIPVFAGWKVVIDKNCIKVVAANTASQKLIEDQHNQRLDSIASKKQKVELYSVSMATIKELYKLTMENVSGFGTESLYYKEIGTCAFDILKDVPELISTVNKAKFKNKLACLTELGGLVMETQQVVAVALPFRRALSFEGILHLGVVHDVHEVAHQLLCLHHEAAQLRQAGELVLEQRQGAESPQRTRHGGKEERRLQPA